MPGRRSRTVRTSTWSTTWLRAVVVIVDDLERTDGLGGLLEVNSSTIGSPASPHSRITLPAPAVIHVDP